jgi:rare lipoprotein A (peptidoglycan hydrolase)
MKGTNRIVDLSPAAAKQIDMIRHGLLKVRVEELPE